MSNRRYEMADVNQFEEKRPLLTQEGLAAEPENEENEVDEVNEVMNPQNGQRRPRPGISKRTGRVLYALKFIVGMLFFGIVLTCSMFSKLTLVNITDRLRAVTWNISEEPATRVQMQATAVSLYWQLFFVMILPNAIAFVRSFVIGVFGKTKKTFPWPRPNVVLSVSHKVHTGTACVQLQCLDLLVYLWSELLLHAPIIIAGN